MKSGFNRIQRLLWITTVIVAVIMPPASHGKPAETVRLEEMRQKDQWVKVNFVRTKAPASKPSKETVTEQIGLLVLENHGPILKNGRPDGRALKLGDTEFQRGLICHAASKVIVKLPSPGKSFVSTVGVDANAGGGSVVFSVIVGDKEAFRSAVMKGSETGVPVSVALDGAREFTITAGDAGDGITSDHADWANAKVTLMDGKEIWLSELPTVKATLPQREASTPPFSFVYGGKSSDNLLGNWMFAESVEKLDENRIQKTQTYEDPITGLQVRAVIVSYRDFPTVEWTIYFKNTGKSNTPIIENIQAVDTTLERHDGTGEFTLHYNKGDVCAVDSFEPLTEVLGPNATKQFAPGGGRPTNGQYPFWNVEMPGGGFLVVLGWPGQWSAQLTRNDGKALRICAGQELTHFTLHSGEEVRSPLVALQFYRGDWIQGQNIWRRWMVAHNIPRPGGKLVPTHYGACWSDPLHPVAEIEMAVLNGYIREKIPLEFYFIDAGWYPGKGNWWEDAGTWEVDKERFPKGIREISDRVHANGMQFVLWFEPERAGAGTWLAQNHPEWILGGKGGGLVNLGNRDAWKWTVERIDSLIVSEGVDVYRQDFNIDPLGYWRGADALDRQGLTEIGHVTGYLAYWDELLRRHPKLWLDSCASGGRRNDLETLRRSVPLLRSDAFGSPIIQQCQTFGLSLWAPYYGSGTIVPTVYWFRSTIFPASRVGWDTRKTDLDYPLLRRMIAEFHKVEPYLLGDYYPLSEYSLSDDVWMAWQFDRPELGEGMMQAFRRDQSEEATGTFRLRGLDPAEQYEVTNLDVETPSKMSGKDLMERGLTVEIKDKPGAALITYKLITNVTASS
jgi:alpha-galactosidase